MRTVLVKKQDIEIMISQIDKHLDFMFRFSDALWDVMLDAEAEALDKENIPLTKCHKILKSYLK